MDSAKTLLTIMKEAGITYAALGRRVGMSLSNVHDKLVGQHSKDAEIPHTMKVPMLVKLANGLDYKVVLMPASARTPKDSYEVDE